MSAMRRWLPITLVLAFSFPATAVSQEGETAPGTAAAQETEAPQTVEDDRSALTDPAEADLDARAAEVAGGLRCPVCRNQSILESNADLSREMHRVVRERLAAGETPEEVEAYFVSRYGEWILLKPQARGINLVVYALPVIVLLLGFLLARNRLRKWARAGAVETSAGATGSGSIGVEDEEWLRDALRES